MYKSCPSNVTRIQVFHEDLLHIFNIDIFILV